MATDPTALKRAIDFIENITEHSYTRKEEWRFGHAYFNDRFPIKWDLNHLRIERDAADLTAEAVAAEAKRVQGGAGLNHRMIYANDGTIGAKLAPGFKELGWIIHHLVMMVHGGEDVPPPTVDVREVAFEDLRPHFEKWDVEIEHNEPAEAEQLAASKEVVRAAVDVRFFAGYVASELAGWCELYSDANVGQIENVCTWPTLRNHGVARSVVVHALEQSRAAGHDLHFLIADQEDWPKELYAKLGFRAVGYIYEYLLRPP